MAEKDKPITGRDEYLENIKEYEHDESVLKQLAKYGLFGSKEFYDKKIYDKNDPNILDIVKNVGRKNLWAERIEGVTDKIGVIFNWIKGEEIEFLDDNTRKARRIREGISPRINPDGSPSTHIMTSGEVTDDKGNPMYIAFPTLFPGYENKKLQATEEWGDLGTPEGTFPEEAYQEAISRNEIFKFDTAKEAKEFASGSWKPEGY